MAQQYNKLYVKFGDGKVKEIMPLDCVPVIGASRTTYKQKVWAWYYNDEITADERDTLIAKHEEKLEKKRKYKQGEVIHSFDELMKQDMIYFYGKIYHYGWFSGWQAGWLQRWLDNGMIYKAIKKEQNNDTNNGQN